MRSFCFTYEVSLSGWNVYLMCEYLTGQNRLSIFLGPTVILISSKSRNLVERKITFTT